MKNLHRLYVNSELIPGDQYTLDSNASNYLIKVLRHSSGEKIQCFNGVGKEAICTISSNNNKATLVQINEIISESIQTPPKLHLAIGLLKGQAMDRAIQHATELGATDIWLLQSERSNTHYNDKRLATKIEHWRKVAISSAQQCGETFLPRIHGPNDISTVFDQTRTAERMIFDPKGGPLEKELVLKERILFIGPEGGWSAQEETYFKAEKASLYSLGKRILRAENSPSVALALVNHAQNQA